MSSILIFQPHNNTFKRYYITSKEELKSAFFQNIFDKIRYKREETKESRVVKCGCINDKNIWLSPTKKGNFLYLKTFRNSPNHNEECIFYDKNREFYEEDKGYNLKIFEETKPKKYNEKLNEYGETLTETSKRVTFYSFCIDWIKKANIFSFNLVNKDSNFYLQNYNYKTFISCFKKVDLHIRDKENTISYDNLSDLGIYCSFGIINNIDYNFSDFDKEKIVEIVNNKDKTIKVTQRRLFIAMKNIKNYSNYKQPPYFYIAIINKYGVAVRLYLMPILYQNDYITFVESNFERKYAQMLLDNKKVFLKPLADEYSYLKRSKAPDIDNFTGHRPDFFIFDKNKISIIEVCGYKNDKNYMQELQEKEQEYSDIISHYKNNNIIFDYKRVNGDEL